MNYFKFFIIIVLSFIIMQYIMNQSALPCMINNPVYNSWDEPDYFDPKLYKVCMYRYIGDGDYYEIIYIPSDRCDF